VSFSIGIKHIQPTRKHPSCHEMGSLSPRHQSRCDDCACNEAVTLSTSVSENIATTTDRGIEGRKTHSEDLDIGNTFLRILANHAAKPYASFPRRRCAFWIGVRSTKPHLSSHVPPVSFVVKARRSQSWFFFCGGPLHTENYSCRTPHALISLGGL